MAFITEYFGEFRAWPITKNKLCNYEDRYAPMKGKWKDTKVGAGRDKEMSDDEIRQFIKTTMKRLRGQSTYFNEHCAHHPPEFMSKEPKKRDKELSIKSLPKILAFKDGEVIKMAGLLYERDLEKPLMKPPSTHFRMFGYIRRRHLNTGLSEYQQSAGRTAYELTVRDSAPRYSAHNGCRARWGPPGRPRQPLLDIVPNVGDRLY